MNVNCQSCGAKYAIADAKVQGRRVKVRCKSCNTTIVVDGGELDSSVDVQVGNMITDPKTLDGSHLSPFALDAGAMWSVSVTDDDQREMSHDQVVAAFKNGEFNDATFAWKEGMADWLPLLQVEEFKALGQAAPRPAAGGIPRPAPAGAQPQAAVAAAAQPPAAAKPHLPSTPAKAAVLPRARLSNTKDLFSPTAGPEEETAPAPFASSSESATGARNESSVLFSLDALKRQSSMPPAPTKGQANNDPFGLGSLSGGGGLGGFGGGGGLFTPDANALLTAPAALPPSAVPSFSAGAVPAFDIAPPQKKKGPLLWMGAAVAVLALGGGAYAVLGGSEESPKADGSSDNTATGDNGSAKSDEAKLKAEDEKKAEEAKLKAEDEKKAEEAKLKAEDEKKAEAATATAGKAAPLGVTPGKPSGPVASSPDASAKPPKGKPVAPAEASGGGSTFNVGAAKAALASAASQAASCKKGGPGGSGKATVTFAPSGRASSVSVSGISGFASNCVNGLFKRTSVPAFSGAPVTVSKGFKIP